MNFATKFHANKPIPMAMVHYKIKATLKANCSIGSDMDWKMSVVNLGSVSVK